MNKRWTGRVVKHLSGNEPVTEYGTTENISLRDRYYPPLAAVATVEDEGKTVREVLERNFAVSSKLLASARATEYGLTINEERVYISAPVEAGEVVRLRMEIESSDDIIPQQLPLQIIYEDDELLIVNKQAGIVVHPTHGHYMNTLANAVVAHWQAQGVRYRFRPIHRLDEETSGVVAIAKNPYVHQQISEQMQQGLVDKYYVAIVYGKPNKEHDLIDKPIDRDRVNPHLRVVREDGYPSQTLYWLQRSFLIDSEHYISLIKLKLLTGRTHQIRVHMDSIGHPLIGDKLYGDNEVTNNIEHLINRHALHAYQLTLKHPMTGESMTFEAPLANDMTTMINTIEKRFKK